MVQISDDEKKIMKAVSEVKQNSQTVHRLAVDLAMNEGTLSRIVDSLIGKKLLFLGAPKQHGNRYLRLTDKGECFVITYCDVDFDILMDNHIYLESQDIIKGIRKAIDGSEMRTKVTQFCTSYLIQKDLFDINGYNIMRKKNYKWEARSILLEWTKFVKNLSIEFQGQIDLKKWAKLMHTYDSSLKVDGILGTSTDKGTISLIKQGQKF